jgi:predicted dienelactone hydrolase
MTYNPFVRGSHPVGVRTIEVRDEARDRGFPIELWYPASATYRGLDLADATRDRFSIAPGLPERVQSAVRSAEPASGRYPLVLHSHCAVSHRRDAALLAPHLASHGYIVIAPDFIGDTLADALGPTPGTRRATDEETIINRPRDAVFALDRVIAGAEPAIARLIDADRIATCGISLGGWTSLRLNSLDPRPKTTFVVAPSWGLTGPFPTTTVQTAAVRLDDWGRTIPIFLVAGERDMLVMLRDLRELYRRLPAPKRFAVLRGASHFHWAEGAEQLYNAFRAMWEGGAISVPGADVAALAKATPPFSALCPNEHGVETLQVLCLAHMDAQLKENPDARRFLDDNLGAAFAARGIALDEVAHDFSPVLVQAQTRQPNRQRGADCDLQPICTWQPSRRRSHHRAQRRIAGGRNLVSGG